MLQPHCYNEDPSYGEKGRQKYCGIKVLKNYRLLGSRILDGAGMWPLPTDIRDKIWTSFEV